MQYIGVAMQAAGQGVEMMTAIQQANAEVKAAKLERKTIRDEAQFQEQQSRRQSQMAIGKQVAVGAASGVDITSGSPLFMELDSVRQAELEALNIRHRGELAMAAKTLEIRKARARKFGVILSQSLKMGGQGAGMMGGGGGGGATWSGAQGGMTSGAGSFGGGGGSILGGWMGGGK